MKRITREDIDDFLGFSKGKTYYSLKLLDEFDLQYSVLTEDEERQQILAELKRIKNDTQVVGGADRSQVWEAGWNENLVRYKETRSLDALAPMYFRPNCPSRLRSHFIKPYDQLFDYNLEKIIKGCLLEEYVLDCEDIYEFGCGTCADIYDLSRILANISSSLDYRLHCRDLTKASVEISELLNKEMEVGIADALQFDFKTPNRDYHLASHSAVYTFSALEQIGDNYVDFINYLIDEKPSIVVHLEPMNEVYDEDDLVDWLAKEFHEKRGYLKNFSYYMKSLEEKGAISIELFRRTKVGGWNHESNTILVWKPL